MAFAAVAPVGDEDVAVGAGEEVDAAEPFVFGLHEIGCVLADIAAAFAVEGVHVDAVAVEIAGEDGAVVFLGPEAALIDEHADVGVAAAELVGLAGDAELADVAPGFRAGIPVKVVGGLLNDFIDVWIEVRAEHAAVVGAGNAVPEVADDGVDPEELAFGIPIVAPGVRAAVADDFKDLPRGMEAPDAAVDLRALFQRRAGCADGGGIGDAVASVKPSIRAPAQAVDDVVADGLHVEAIEQHLGLAIGGVVAVFVGNEAERAVVQHPSAAVASLHAGEVAAAFPEDLSHVVFAIAVLVFEDDDAVPQLRVPADGVLGKGVVFRHPQAPLRIPRHRDRLLHIRLGGKDNALEARRQFHRGRGFLSGHGRAFFGVVDGWEVGGGERRAKGEETEGGAESHGIEET